MQEEFHGNGTAALPATQWKLLYGWGTINVNVWLPSLSELVGTTWQKNDTTGCYVSAMQEVNLTANQYIDQQGGEQFAYFEQYNASGGGTKLFDVCNQQVTWLRSPSCGHTTYTWQITNSQRFDWVLPAASRAVHPAVKILYPSG